MLSHDTDDEHFLFLTGRAFQESQQNCWRVAMTRRLMPLLLIAIGVLSIAEPMKAIGNCGLNPITYVPSECYPPVVASANPPTNANCMWNPMGGCTTVFCGGTNYENVLPAKCGQTVITEGNVPRCEENFATTIVDVNQYSWSCNPSTCVCTGTRTGVVGNVQICNCRNLTPLN